MAFSPEEIQAREEWRRRDEEARLAQVAMVVDFARTWARCDRKECRRERGCADLNHCGTRYEKEILAWQREVLVPYLRERYPTVRWGAPASIAQVQLEAALEAEKDLSEAERSEKCGEALARIEARARRGGGGRYCGGMRRIAAGPAGRRRFAHLPRRYPVKLNLSRGFTIPSRSLIH